LAEQAVLSRDAPPVPPELKERGRPRGERGSRFLAGEPGCPQMLAEPSAMTRSGTASFRAPAHHVVVGSAR